MSSEPSAPQNDTASESRATVAAILSDIKALRNDVSRLGESLAEIARQRATAAGSSIAGAMGEAGSQATQVASEVHESIHDIEAELRRQIRQRPLAAALFLIALGYALGAGRRRAGR